MRQIMQIKWRICKILLTVIAGISTSLVCNPNSSCAQTLSVGNEGTYSTIKGAYSATGDNDSILVQSGTYVENVDLGEDRAVSIIGGYDSNFSDSRSYSEIDGTLTISNGKVTLQKMIINFTVTDILLNDNFAGTMVNSGNWHIPTWVSPKDGTYLGQTQFRCTPNPLPIVTSGNAVIALDTYNSTGSSFFGTDLISNQLFPIGQGLIVTVRAKLSTPIQPGLIGGIFLYAPPADSSNNQHDEIDFELLTNDPNKARTNIYSNEPLGIGHPGAHPYPYSGSVTDYHTYQIRWLPTEVSWYIDGSLVRAETTHSSLPTGPMYLHLNIWVPAKEYTDAYNADFLWTNSQSTNQTYSMIVDSVTVYSVENK